MEKIYFLIVLSCAVALAILEVSERRSRSTRELDIRKRLDLSEIKQDEIRRLIAVLSDKIQIIGHRIAEINQKIRKQ